MYGVDIIVVGFCFSLKIISYEKSLFLLVSTPDWNNTRAKRAESEERNTETAIRTDS